MTASVSEDSPPAAATTAAPAVTEVATDLPATATEEDIVETTTTITTRAVAVKKFSAEDPIISDLPEIDTVDQNTIEEGALQVKQVKDEDFL